MRRRTFVANAFQAAAFTGIAPFLPSFIKEKNSKITEISLFRYDVNIPRYFSWGTWYNRQQIFMKLSAGDYYGWAEVAGSKNNPDLDLKQWGGFLNAFKGKTISEVYQWVKDHQVSGPDLNKKQLEFVEMALLDILGKIENKSAPELLGFSQKNPVPGLFCILHKDPEEIAKYIQQAKDQDLQHFMKFKMYGDEKTDLAILKQARELLGNDPFILSDANRGYKKWENISELTKILSTLKDNGLNAMEDPAELSNQQWIELQQNVGKLDLIPDYPTRPAWEGVDKIEKGMGRLYNLHPESMGSFHHLSAIVKKIESFKAGIMIGDASLVGPACNVWQQVAIGAGASWVEAIEKQEDSADYLKCLKSKPTFRNEKGHFALKKANGFGLELDEQLLKEVCPVNYQI